MQHFKNRGPYKNVLNNSGSNLSKRDLKKCRPICRSLKYCKDLNDIYFQRLNSYFNVFLQVQRVAELQLKGILEPCYGLPTVMTAWLDQMNQSMSQLHSIL